MNIKKISLIGAAVVAVIGLAFLGRTVTWVNPGYVGVVTQFGSVEPIPIKSGDGRALHEDRDAGGRILNQILDHRPFFDLVSRIIDLLLSAKSPESAQNSLNLREIFQICPEIHKFG